LAENKAIELSQQLQSSSEKPHLAIILIGNNPASEQYVRMKQKQAEQIGIKTTLVHLPQDTPQNEAISTVKKLGISKEINGILIQLPLPETYNIQQVLDSVPFEKDVDGLTSKSLSLLEEKTPHFVPAVAKAVLSLILSVEPRILGKNIVIIGRGKYVGEPIGNLLANLGARITFCDEFTQDIPSISREADILVSAVGKPQFVTQDYVKKGAIVIDVGTSLHPATGKIVGDCDSESVSKKAKAITPVPGGVGPMTIISLLEQTIDAWKFQINSSKTNNES
jgi:methylenetetrahydrofolate dehydrogenase (NADP+)/methenyltetrahydrofolate cyclohydrolase